MHIITCSYGIMCNSASKSVTAKILRMLLRNGHLKRGTTYFAVDGTINYSASYFTFILDPVVQIGASRLNPGQ